uniref:Protein HGH1 homolog n=1 Tax=Heterorhabditis bacteriophora TaxID=37862 RepID=A0A1I7XJU1_HETBA
MFSDCCGPRSLLSLVTGVSGEWRSSALQLLKQLLLQANNDQYIAGLIQITNQSCPQQQLQLNIDLLKVSETNTVLGVLRESHKVRLQFRKTGGYLCLISMLLGLENAFSGLDNLEC